MKEQETLKEKLYWFWKLKIVNRYTDIKHWCKYHFTKRYWNVLKTCLHSYPWDYSFLYQIEEAKLKEMLDYHEHSHIVFEESREQMIRTLKWALSMLHIIQNEDKYCHFTGEAECVPVVDLVDENGDYILTEWDNGTLEYHCDCVVNTKNYSRFKISKQMVESSPHSLYVEKARTLYHKIRQQYEQYWWD